MEKRVQSEFGKLDACLTKEEKAGRVDIKYRKTTGSHVIIELKRASVKTNTNALIAQMQKYRSGLSKLLQACSGAGNLNHHIECIFVVGENLGDWDYENGRENSQAQFTSQHMRLLQYSELLENANKAYHEYIKATQKVNRLQDILSALDEEDSN